jgi:DNA polymerase I-like protein with 3'-5' exonuclease and polymerase domains
MEVWETIFLNESRCDDLPDGFGSGPSRLLRTLRAQRESEITASTLDKLMGDDDELLKASGLQEAIEIMALEEEFTDPAEFRGEAELQLYLTDPRRRKADDDELAKRYQSRTVHKTKTKAHSVAIGHTERRTDRATGEEYSEFVIVGYI